MPEIGLSERLRKEFSTFGIVMIPLMIGVNIAAGWLGSFTPVWLDTVGTMIAGVVLGPFIACIIGCLTNIFKFLVFDPYAFPYLIVNGLIGLVTGILAYLGFFPREYTPKAFIKVLIAGILLALVATFVSGYLNITLWGGYTGKAWADVLIDALLALGYDVATASYLAEFVTDILDKPISAVLVWLVYMNIPKRFAQQWT